mgnify:FL=1
MKLYAKHITAIIKYINVKIKNISLIITSANDIIDNIKHKKDAS